MIRIAFTLAAVPDRTWATGPGAAPPSLSVPASRTRADACSLTG